MADGNNRTDPISVAMDQLIDAIERYQAWVAQQELIRQQQQAEQNRQQLVSLVRGHITYRNQVTVLFVRGLDSIVNKDDLFNDIEELNENLEGYSDIMMAAIQSMERIFNHFQINVNDSPNNIANQINNASIDYPELDFQRFYQNYKDVRSSFCEMLINVVNKYPKNDQFEDSLTDDQLHDYNRFFKVIHGIIDRFLAEFGLDYDLDSPEDLNAAERKFPWLNLRDLHETYAPLELAKIDLEAAMERRGIDPNIDPESLTPAGAGAVSHAQSVLHRSQSPGL